MALGRLEDSGRLFYCRGHKVKISRFSRFAPRGRVFGTGVPLRGGGK